MTETSAGTNVPWLLLLFERLSILLLLPSGHLLIVARAIDAASATAVVLGLALEACAEPDVPTHSYSCDLVYH